jgi:transposase InsO family protein
MITDLPFDALEMAIWARNERLDGLVHHSDRGSQYTAIRYTERLVEAGIGAATANRYRHRGGGFARRTRARPGASTANRGVQGYVVLTPCR